MSDDVNHSEEHPVTCPRCGKDITQPQLKVSEDVLRDYVKHMLGGRRFKKIYELFDGALRVTFEEPTAGEDWKKQATGGPRELAGDKYMLLTLASVETVDSEAGVVKYLYNKTPNERLELIRDVPASMESLSEALTTVQLAVVSRCATVFAALLSVIIAEVTSADFYEGAGLL